MRTETQELFQLTTGLMAGRVALVTGASRGIGAATAKLFAKHGASVAVNYMNSAEAAAKVVSEIEAEGGRGLAVRADVRDAAQVNAMVERVQKELGPVDTLVINANMQFSTACFSDHRWEDFERKLLGEMGGAFFTVKAVLPEMMKRRRGSIVAISSGLSRHPGRGFVAHTTAKSALDGLMKSLALELGPHGIRVNVVAPGLTLTDATAAIPEEAKEAAGRALPLGRNGLPEDIAGAVLAVASDLSGYVTGAYIPVSGGGLML
jgi:3-oxoacyl-[acyl-carrier protein] reductase